MDRYSGNKDPFVYVAYDKCDEARALETVKALGEKVRVYCAYSFSAKEQKILSKAAAVVPVVSEGSVRTIEEAVAFAAGKGKDLLPVFLDNAELPAGLSMLLGTTQGVFRGAYMDEAEFAKALQSSPLLGSLRVTPEQTNAAKNAIIIGVVAAVAVVAAVLLTVLNPFAADKIDPESPLGKLGLSGNASKIKTVALYGDQLKDEFQTAGVYQISSGIHETNVSEVLYLAGSDETVERGTLSDISDFAQLTNLEELSLCGNAVQDITPLLGLTKLKKLDLSAQHYNDVLSPEERENAALSLVGISRLTSLEYLDLSYCNLGPEETRAQSGIMELKDMPNFKTLVLERDSEYIADMLGDVNFEIVLRGTVVNDYEEMKAAAADKSCHSIYVNFDSVIDIPQGETFTLPAYVQLNGTNFELNNYGTFEIYGVIECGLDQETNYGTMIVKPGGCYVGGMSDLYNEGAFIIEEGGLQSLERGKLFEQRSGSYVNNGNVFIGVGGVMNINGGTAENNGVITVQYFPESMGGMFGDDWYQQKYDVVNAMGGSGRLEIQEGGEW